MNLFKFQTAQQFLFAVKKMFDLKQNLRKLLAWNRQGNRVDRAQTGDLLENLG